MSYTASAYVARDPRSRAAVSLCARVRRAGRWAGSRSATAVLVLLGVSVLAVGAQVALGSGSAMKMLAYAACVGIVGAACWLLAQMVAKLFLNRYGVRISTGPGGMWLAQGTESLLSIEQINKSARALSRAQIDEVDRCYRLMCDIYVRWCFVEGMYRADEQAEPNEDFRAIQEAQKRRLAAIATGANALAMVAADLREAVSHRQQAAAAMVVDDLALCDEVRAAAATVRQSAGREQSDLGSAEPATERSSVRAMIPQSRTSDGQETSVFNNNAEDRLAS